MSIAGRLIARAGWAAILVFMLHVIFSSGLDIYHRYRFSDMPMHFFGGVAIAYFLSTCFAALPRDVMADRWRPAAQFVTVVCLTATVAVFWEFAEYFSDTLFRTRVLGNVNDTLQDLAFGISGAVSFMLTAWLTGRLGKIRPIDAEVDKDR